VYIVNWMCRHGQEGTFGLTDWDVSLLRGVGVDCDILPDGILIPSSYSFFSKSLTVKNFIVKRAKKSYRVHTRIKIHRKD
jgi:hypothetical protein